MVWHSKMSIFCKKRKMYTFHVVTSFTIHTSSWLLIACNNSNVVYLGSCTSPNNLMNLTPPTSSPIQSSKSEMEKWKNKFHRKKLVRKKTKLVIPIEKNYSYDKINCERKWKRKHQPPNYQKEKHITHICCLFGFKAQASILGHKHPLVYWRPRSITVPKISISILHL
jgi:hypothetical protein